MWDPVSSQPCQHLTLPLFKYIYIYISPNRYVTSSGVKHHFMWLFVICISSLVHCLLLSFVSFLTEFFLDHFFSSFFFPSFLSFPSFFPLFLPSTLSFEYSLYALDKNLFSDVCCQYFLPVYSLSLHASLIVFLKNKGFHCFEVMQCICLFLV